MKYIFSNILRLDPDHSCTLKFVRVTEGFLISKQDAAFWSSGSYYQFNILPGNSVKFVAFRLSESTLHFAASCPNKPGGKQREHLNHSQMQMTALVNRSSCSMLIWETVSNLLLLIFFFPGVLFESHYQIYQRSIVHSYEKWNRMPQCDLWELVCDHFSSYLHNFNSPNFGRKVLGLHSQTWVHLKNL